MLKSNLVSKFVPLTVRELDRGFLEISTTILTRAQMLAPEDTQALVNSGRIERVAAGVYLVIFGSTRVPYARRRHFENKKNPQTLNYLSRAGDSVYRSNINKYFGRKI